MSPIRRNYLKLSMVFHRDNNVINALFLTAEEFVTLLSNGFNVVEVFKKQILDRKTGGNVKKVRVPKILLFIWKQSNLIIPYKRRLRKRCHNQRKRQK